MKFTGNGLVADTWSFFVFCFLYSDYKFYVKMLVGWKFYDSPDKLFGLESLRFDKSLW